jgi:transposase-like protein
MNAFNQPDPGLATSSPPACPVCKGAAVTTTAKHPDANSYWRCKGCGEVWNIGRRHDAPSRSIRWR